MCWKHSGEDGRGRAVCAQRAPAGNGAPLRANAVEIPLTLAGPDSQQPIPRAGRGTAEAPEPTCPPMDREVFGTNQDCGTGLEGMDAKPPSAIKAKIPAFSHSPPRADLIQGGPTLAPFLHRVRTPPSASPTPSPLPCSEESLANSGGLVVQQQHETLPGLGSIS